MPGSDGQSPGLILPGQIASAALGGVYSPISSPVYGSSSAAIFSFIMGALTPAGMGDMATTGSSFTSGNASGHFQISGGAITGSAAGVAAGYNAGPYVLKTNAGETFNITRVANAYSVGKASDFNGGSGVGKLGTPTLNGKRIIGRPSLSMAFGINGGFGTPLRNTNFGDVGTAWAGVVIESEDLTRPWTCTDTIDITGRYITFRGIAGTLTALGTVPGTQSGFFTIDGNSIAQYVTDIVIDRCVVNGAFKDVNSNVWASDDGSLWSNGRFLTANGSPFYSNIRVIGCTCMYAYRGVVLAAYSNRDAGSGNLVSQSVHFAGNYFYGYYEHGLNVSIGDTGVGQTLTVEDNVFDTVVGKATDLSGPHPDHMVVLANASMSANWPVTWNRNFVFHNGRGNASVSYRNAANGFKYVVTAIGNIHVDGSAEGFESVDADSCVLLYNAILSNEVGDSALRGMMTFGAGGGASSGTHRLTGNIAEIYQIGGSPTLSGNITLGVDEGTIPFANVFVGPRPQSRALALTALVTRGIYTAAGPLGTAVPVNYPAANPSNILGSNNVS